MTEKSVIAIDCADYFSLAYRASPELLRATVSAAKQQT